MRSFLMIFVLAVLVSAADTTGFRWSYFTNMENINALSEYDGVLCVATDGGIMTIAYYLDLFTYYLKSDATLYDNRIEFIGVDSTNTFYAGSGTDGVSIFDGNNWRYESGDLSQFKPLPYLRQPHCIDTNGNIWFMSSNQPAYFDGEAEHIASDGLPSETPTEFSAITMDGNGTLYCVIDSTIYVYDGTRWSDTLETDYIGNTGTSFAAGPVSFFIGTTKGVCGVNSTGTTWHTIASGALESDRVSCVYVDIGGRLWAGTDFGLYRYDDIEWEKINVNYCKLPTNNISHLACNMAGEIWGTGDKWICRYDGTEWSSWTLEDAGFSANASAIGIAATNDAVYVGSDDKICRFANDQWETVLDIQTAGVSNFSRIEADRDGMIWIATAENGLISLNGGGTVTPLTLNAPFTQNVTFVYVDAGNTVWFGTDNNKFGKVTGDGVEERAINSAVSNSTAFAVDKEGTFWLAPENDGFLADGEASTNEFPSDSFSSAFSVADILVDSQGEKWIATNSGELVYGAARDNSPSDCVVFNASNSGYVAGGVAIVEDRKGTIWIGGENGITVLKRTNYIAVEHDLKDTRQKYDHFSFDAVQSKSSLLIKPDFENRLYNFRMIDLKGRTAIRKKISGTTVVQLEKQHRMQPGAYLLQLGDEQHIETRMFTIAR